MKKLISIALAGLMALAWLAGAVAQESGTTATLNIQAANGGTLFVQIDNVTFQSVHYSFQNQQTSATVVVRAEDTRGSGQGWNVTIRGTNFQSQSGTGASFEISNLALGNGSVDRTEGMLTEGISATSLNNMSDQAQKIAVAQQNKGMGKYRISYPATLTVPGGTPAGDYHSTLTVAITSGP